VACRLRKCPGTSKCAGPETLGDVRPSTGWYEELTYLGLLAAGTGNRACAGGDRRSVEAFRDQPGPEEQLEQTAGDHRHHARSGDAENLQQASGGEDGVANDAPGCQEPWDEVGAVHHGAEEDAAHAEPSHRHVVGQEVPTAREGAQRREVGVISTTGGVAPTDSHQTQQAEDADGEDDSLEDPGREIADGDAGLWRLTMGNINAPIPITRAELTNINTVAAGNAMLLATRER
jgi:hypothetical protein